MIKHLPPILQENSRRYGFLLFLFFSLFLTAGAFAQTVTSDKDDYAPRSNAIFTGKGFAASENVVLKVKNLSRPCNTVSADSSYLAFTVKADISGNFITNWTVCDCPGDSLRLKATGQTSGYIAYAYFTDSDQPVPSTPDLATGSDNGTSNTDNKTSLQTLTFTGTVTTLNTGGGNANYSTLVVELLSGTTLIGSQTISGISTSSAGSYNYSITTTAPLSSGTHSITARAKHTHLNGNSHQSLNSSALTVEIDNTSPTVTINKATTQANPTSASPINFTVVFSETVTGFTPSDVTLSGTAGATTASITQLGTTGTTYNVAVSGMTANGSVVAAIAADAVIDVAGNGNTASTSTDITVTYNGACTLPSITAQPTSNNSTFTYGDTPNPSFSVSTSGDISGYQWQILTTAPGATWGDISGATSASYTVLNPTVAMNGFKYRVIVSGCSSTLPPSNAATLTVKPKALVASLTGTVSKEYNGDAVATLAAANYQLAGVLGTDAVALNNPATGSYNDKTVNTGKLVSVTGLTISGADAANYTVNASASASIGSITAKALVASLTGTVSKEYNGDAVATLAAANYQLAGVLGTDAVALNNPATGSYNDKTVNTGKLVSVTGLTISGADAANYTVNASASASIGSITAKALVASLTGTVSKEYNGDAVATLAAANYQLAGVLGTDAVALNNPATGSYNDKTVNTGKLVSVTGLTISGADAANYTVNASASASIGSITAKALVASLTGTVSKEYNGDAVATLAAANYQLAGVLGTDAVALNNPATGSYNDKTVNTGKLVSVTGLTISGADAANYTVNASASASIGSITAKALVASLTGTVSKEYNGDAVATLAAANYQLAGVLGTDAVALNNPATGSYNDKTVNTGKLVSVTGLTISGADAANYTVNASASASIGSITAKALVASLTGTVSKEYNGDAVATLAAANYQLAGVLGTDAVALNNPATGSYNDKTVNTGKLVSVTGLTISGADAANYTVNASASASIGSITAKALVASLTGTVSKEYNGDAVATLAAANYQLAGVLGTDAVALNNPATGSYNDKTVNTGKLVSVTGLTISGADAANYTVNASASASIGSITAKALVASLTGTVSKEYNGDAVATLAAANYQLAGVLGTDAVALNNPATGSYNDKTVNTGKLVSVTGLTISGADAANYTVNASASASIGSITAKALVASLTGTVSKEYNGDAVATLAAANYQLAGVLGTDAVALNNPATGSYNDKTVNTGKLVSVTGLTISGADAANYTVNASASASIGSITAKALVASLTGTVSKEYNGDAVATLAAANYQLAGVLGTDAVALNNPATGSYNDKTVNTGKLVSVTGLTISGADAANYTVNASASASIGSITAKALVASLTGTVSKEYNGDAVATLAAANYQLAGVLGTDAVALNNPATGSYNDKTVNTGKLVSVTGLTISGADAANYTVNASASASIGSITAKALVASLTGTVSKEYNGDAVATLAAANYQLAGVLGTDAVALNNPATGSYNDKTVNTGKLVSVTGLTISGADAANYTVNASASASIGSITAKALVASLTGTVSKEYNGDAVATLAAANYQLAGVLGTDAVALNNPATGSYNDKTVNTGKLVSVTGLTISGADAANYTVNASASASIGSITAKALVASLTGTVSKEYNGDAVATLAAANYQLAGVLGTDAVALNNPATGSYNDKTVNTGKLVSVTGLTISGADAANYTVNASASASIGSITAKALVASLTGTVSKEYNGDAVATLAAANYQLAGVLGTDAVALNNPAAGSYNDKTVNTGKLVSVTGLTISGADAANYTVNASASASIGSITAKALVIGITADDKEYNGTTAAVTSASITSGLVAGDMVTVSSNGGQFNDKNVGTNKDVTASVSKAGVDANNYSANTTATAKAAITPKALVGSFTVANKMYDGNNTATVTSYSVATKIGTEDVNISGGTATFNNEVAGHGKIVTLVGAVLSGTAKDNYTLTSVNTTTATIFAAPTVSLDVPSGPVQLNNKVTILATFGGDVINPVWNYNSPTDKTTRVSDNELNITSPSIAVYTVTLSYTDGMGKPFTTEPVYAVFYDPTQGFVTGGGWIWSNKKSYVVAPELEGKATFGFNSKIEKGASTPTGNTEFQFHAGSLNFKSTNYQWLTVSGARAQYKGTGTINGTGVYGFMLTAIDGQVNGGGGTDKFRIKIWRGANESDLVYDNQLGDATASTTADAVPSTVLGGGSIIIHQAPANKKSERVATEADLFAPATATEAKLAGYPNPFRDNATIAFTFGQDEEYNLDIYDTKGALVKHFPAGKAKANTQVEVKVDDAKMPTGVYIIRLSTKTKVQNLRMVRE